MREKDREREREEEREEERERKRERDQERGREREYLFLIGMTGALAPFTYLAINIRKLQKKSFIRLKPGCSRDRC